MSTTSKTINIKFDASMDIKNVKAALSDIEKGLGGVKLPVNITKDLERDVVKLRDEIKNFESVSSSMKGLGDIGKSEKSLQKISELFRKIELEASHIQGIDSDKLLSSDIVGKIGKAEKAIKDYGKSISDIEKESKKSGKAIEDLITLKKDLTKKETDKTTNESNWKAAIKERELNRDNIAILKEKRNLLKEVKELTPDQKLELEGYTKEIGTREDNRVGLTADVNRNHAAYEATLDAIEANKKKQDELTESTKKYGTTIKELENSLSKLGKDKTADAFSTLREELEKIDGLDVTGLKEDLSNIDDVTKGISEKALEEVNTALEGMRNNADGAAKSTDKIDDSLKATKEGAEQIIRAKDEVDNLKRSILGFFSVGNAVQLFKRAIKDAFQSIKELDEAMTQTAVVTEFTVGDMWSELPSYTKRANELGITVKGAYEAATLYYQQGLSTNEVIGVSAETLKMAKIAGLDYAKATDFMTAALRGFNMEIDNNSAQKINDIYSKLAAITAADTQEIAIAMTKAASIAKSANMEFETTSAFLSQIIETTREAPETAGTALKTVIARFQELKKSPEEIGEVDGEMIDANKIEGALRTIDVALRNTDGQFRKLDDVFIDMASKWDGLDSNTQRYIATVAAGSRQQSRFLAMMSDYSRTAELVDAAYGSAGAGQKQFEKTLDSLETALNRLENAWNEFTMGIANSTVIKGAVTLLTGLLEVVNGLTSGLGDVGGAFGKFMIAFAAFKGGGKLLKGAFLTNILGGASGQALEKTGVLAGMKFSLGMFKGIFQEKDLLKGIDLSNVFGPALDDIKNDLIMRMESVFPDGSENRQVGIDLINTGEIAKAEELIKKVDKAGFTLSKNSENQLKAANRNWIGLGMAISGAGLALSAIGSKLDEMGYETAGKIFTQLGTAALAFGTIMSVVVPMMVKRGTTAITASLLSIPVLGWIIGITAALILLVNVFKSIHKSSKETMKELTNQTAAFSEALKEAQGASEDLKNSFKEYGDIKNTLDELTVGTNEWKQALIEANNKVMELIGIYPELAKYLTKGEHGELVLTEEGLEAVSAAQERAVSNAQVAHIGAQMRETMQNQVLGKEAVMRGLNDQGIEVRRGGSVDAQVNSEQLFNKIAKELEERPEQLLKVDADGSFSDLLVNIAKGSGFTNEQIFEKIGDIQNYLNNVDSGNLQLEGQAQALLSSKVSEDTLLSEYSNEILGIFSKNITSKEYQNELNTKRDQLDTIDSSELKKLAEEYNVINLMGSNKKENLSEVYKAMSGVAEIPDDIKNSTEALAEAIADMVLIEEKAAKADEFKQSMGGLDKDSQKKAAALISGEGRNLNVSDLKGLKTEDLKDYSKEMGYEGLNELAHELGLKNGFALEKLVEENIEILENSYKDAEKELKGKGIDSEIYKDMGVDTISSLANQISGMSSQSAKLFVEKWEKVVKSSDLGKAEQEQLQKYLSTVDWSDLSSRNKALKHMQELGVDSKDIDAYWQAAVKGAKGYYKSIEDVNSATKAFQKTMVDGKEGAARLAEGTGTLDDLALLEKSGIDLSDAWYWTAEGIEVEAEIIQSALLALSNQLIREGENNLLVTKELLDKAKGLQESGVGVGAITTYDEDTKQYESSSEINEGNVRKIAEQLNVEKGSNSEKEYIEEVRNAYVEYIATLNKTEEIKKRADRDAEVRTMEAQAIAVKEIKDHWKEWNKVMKEGKSAADYKQTFNSLTQSFKGLLGTSRELSEEFLTNAENIELMKKAADGDETALWDLSQEAGVDYIIQLKAETDDEQVQNKLEEFANYIKNYDLPDLEVGAELDDTNFVKALNQMLENGDLTAEEMKAIFKTMRYDVEIGYRTGLAKIPQPDGTDRTQEMQIPYIKTITSDGPRNRAIISANKNKDKKSGGGGGGSGSRGGSEPYDSKEDPYYNIVQKIAAEERKQVSINEEYNALLESRLVTGEKLLELSKRETRSLNQQAALHQDLLVKRKAQMKKQLTDNSSLSKYVGFNWKDMRVEIDYASIKGVTDEKLGKKIEEHKAEIEKIQGQIQTSEDKLRDITKAIVDLENRGRDNYLALFDRIFDALVAQQEKLIDEMKTTNQAIDDAASNLMDSIKTNIDKMRKDRENDKTETALAEKERRLAYLRQDTSGANLMEIKQLEKDLEEGRQDYTDSLVDQALEELQEQNDAAAEQRSRQIEIAEAQLKAEIDEGRMAAEANRILEEGIGSRGVLDKNSEMYKLLYETDKVASMTRIAMLKWMDDLTLTTAQGFEGTKEIESTDWSVKMRQSMQSGNIDRAEEYEADRNSKIDKNDLDYAKTRIMDSYKKGWNGTPKDIDYMAHIIMAWNKGQWAEAFELEGLRDRKTYNSGDKTYPQTYGDLTMAEWIAKTKGKTFKTGGIADYTGPAWMDGTKSKPELVLNSKDTENFLKLRNILSGSTRIPSSKDGSGSNYIDININVDELSNDYDVDQLADRIKQIIYTDSTYRNVNTINFLR